MFSVLVAFSLNLLSGVRPRSGRYQVLARSWSKHLRVWTLDRFLMPVFVSKCGRRLGLGFSTDETPPYIRVEGAGSGGGILRLQHYLTSSLTNRAKK